MRGFKAAFRNATGNGGFVLPIALTMGIVMILVGVAAVARSQNTRLNSFARKQTAGGSLMVAEGGMARTLAQLTKVNNSVLLTENYDVINPETNRTYLGADGILNNGDEESTPLNQWANGSGVALCSNTPNSGTPDITYNGIIGDGDTYTLKAYRYNSATNTGSLLVEGKRKTSISLIKVTISVDSVVSDFPGVVAVEKMELTGRDVIGSNGNVYYDPAFSNNSNLTGYAAPSDPNRADYLNAIRSGTNDYSDDNDSIDNVGGKIIACKLNPTFGNAPQGTNLGNLKKDQTITGSVSGITYYQTDKIELDNKIINVDTTAGAVYIYINGAVKMKGNAQIRNIRTDGIEQRVGDLRIIISKADKIEIKDNVCIQNAFFYAPQGTLTINSSGNGCPSNVNTNIDGVVWAKEIINNSNNDSGIAVPDDVSSLSDIADSIGLPATKKFGTVTSWQRQQL
jgi:hypothetical protein